MRQYKWIFAVHLDGRHVENLEVVLSYPGRNLALANMVQNVSRWLTLSHKLTVLERHPWTPGELPPLVA